MAKAKRRKPEGCLDHIKYAFSYGNKMSKDDLQKIHMATMQVFQEVGILVEDEKAKKIFADGGCIVDGDIVKIPQHIAEECIRSAPSTMTLYARNPKYDYFVQQKKVCFISFGEGVNVIDPYTREFRMSTKLDLERNTRVCDALDIFPLAYRSVASQDKAPEVQSLHNFEAMLHNTSKHIFIGPDGEKNANKIIDMCAHIVGGREELKKRPIVTFNVCPNSPLQLTKLTSDTIILSAKAGIPVNIISMAMAGATSCITTAATLVTHNAEVLSGLILSQLTEKGAPCIYASSTTIMDMSTITAPVGAPELGMISNAVAQLAQYYLLPCFVAGG